MQRSSLACLHCTRRPAPTARRISPSYHRWRFHRPLLQRPWFPVETPAVPARLVALLPDVCSRVAGCEIPPVGPPNTSPWDAAFRIFCTWHIPQSLLLCPLLKHEKHRAIRIANALFCSCEMALNCSHSAVECPMPSQKTHFIWCCARVVATRGLGALVLPLTFLFPEGGTLPLTFLCPEGADITAVAIHEPTICGIRCNPGFISDEFYDIFKRHSARLPLFDLISVSSPAVQHRIR